MESQAPNNAPKVVSPDESSPTNDLGKVHEKAAMPFVAHLDELRVRLIRSLIAIGVTFCGTLYFSQDLFRILTRPLIEALPKDGSQALYFTGLSIPFLNDLKVSLFSAIFFASPFILFQFWQFIAPGLHVREKIGILSLTAFSTMLFLAGVAFAYFVVFPFSFRFFLSYATNEIRPIITIDDYLTFSTRLFLGFGSIFQMPLVVLMLTLSGLINGKKILSVWRYTIVAIAILSAALTPPDIASMLFMMVPLLCLYALSIGLAFLFQRRPSR